VPFVNNIEIAASLGSVGKLCSSELIVSMFKHEGVDVGQLAASLVRLKVRDFGLDELEVFQEWDASS